MRIAILAACAGTLALMQADVVRANYGAASEPSRSEVIPAEGQNQENGAVRFAYIYQLTASTDEKMAKQTKRGVKASHQKNSNAPVVGFAPLKPAEFVIVKKNQSKNARGVWKAPAGLD